MYMCVCVCVCFNRSAVSDSVIPWTVAWGSSVHGIPQARILESAATPFSRGSSRTRDWTQVSCIAGRFFTVWAIREVYIYANTLFTTQKITADTLVYFCLYSFPPLLSRNTIEWPTYWQINQPKKNYFCTILSPASFHFTVPKTSKRWAAETQGLQCLHWVGLLFSEACSCLLGWPDFPAGIPEMLLTWGLFRATLGI